MHQAGREELLLIIQEVRLVRFGEWCLTDMTDLSMLWEVLWCNTFEAYLGFPGGGDEGNF